MSRYFKMIFVALFAISACVKEPEFIADKGNILKDGCLSIEFGHRNFEDIAISTRSTVPTASEDALINIYALIFDSNGKKIYGNFFNSENRKNSVDELNTDNCWYVDNQDSAKGNRTWGTLRMKSPTDFSGGEIFLFGNIDPIMLNLSAEKLNLIKSRQELQELSLSFNQQSTSRTGNLLMVGSAGISIGSSTNSISLDPSGRISLERLDSKIEVNMAVIPGALTETTDKFGNIQQQEVESFTPTSWRVVNLPAGSWVLKRTESKADELFDSSVHLFETRKSEPYRIPETQKDTTRLVHGFSFYMLEHKPSANKDVSNYHQRDKRLKNTNGEYITGTDGNIWEYAPKDATYLVIEGEVQMKVDDQSAEDGKSQTLNGLVTYYVHLGHFDPKTGGDLDNYDILRNTHYTYNINITGVNSIEVEVKLDNASTEWSDTNERQSGATGEVYIAQEEIYTFDAHYGQRVFRFNFDAILKTLGIKVNNGIIEDYDGALEEIADELTWYVSSPYGREGTPDRVNVDVEVANGLDYKWVHFLKNDMPDGRYDTKNQWYPGDPYKGKLITKDVPNNPTAKGKTLMDVSQLCNYLRQQIARAAMGLESDFDDDRNIYFTAFVDEYYYDIDPISEESRPMLWHEFVNQPMRMMHILCSAEVSRDEHSSATGSVVTIRQRSIQTIYDTEKAVTGWGCETVDEIRATKKTLALNPDARASVGFFDRASKESSGIHSDNTAFDTTPVGNNSKHNGLNNSVRLWKLGTPIDDEYQINWNRWLNFVRENDHDNHDVVTNFLHDDDKIATLRYSCLMRNRDNDGDGMVDKNEIRWYLASSEQLISLFIGDLGLSGIAQLYNIENPTGTNYKCHVVSSTANSTGSCAPNKVFAEEGCSIGLFSSYIDNVNEFSARCVRNLGLKNGTEEFDTESVNDYPPPPIKVTREGDNYKFDLSELNKSSKRISVSEELVPMDEYSEMSRVADGFETGVIGNSNTAVGTYDQYVSKIKDYLIKGYSYCPEGYRMPNLREGAIMHNYIDNDLNNDGIEDNDASHFWTQSFWVCTYYHFGNTDAGGLGFDSRRGWFFNSGIISIGNGGGNQYVRCVRDI